VAAMATTATRSWKEGGEVGRSVGGQADRS
jgi:hypothetical protein